MATYTLPGSMTAVNYNGTSLTKVEFNGTQVWPALSAEEARRQQLLNSDKRITLSISGTPMLDIPVSESLEEHYITKNGYILRCSWGTDYLRYYISWYATIWNSVEYYYTTVLEDGINEDLYN